MIGLRLGGYEIVEHLGAGAMGTVYLAVNGTERVAIKVLHSHLLGEPGLFKRFVQETILGRRVSHPNIVRTFDGDMNVVNGEPRYFIVMEYVEGRTVGSLLEEVGPFPEALVVEVARQVALGLEAIHAQGIVHRDLKPENILVTNDEVVKLMDLGVAQIDEAGLRLSTTGDFVGTVPYAAPEQFRARDDLDGRTDLFSLGVVLYQIATGVHPFQADDAAGFIHGILYQTPRRLSAVRSGVTPQLEATVHRLLARNPDDRFASAGAVVTALDARHPTPILETEPLLRRRPDVARETELRGRHVELERISGLFDDVKKGRGRVVLVEGEVGMGKTRLVDEFVARCREAENELDFLFGVYPPGGAATGLEAFSRSLQDRLQEEDLEVALCRLLDATPSLAAPFAATLRGEPGGLTGDAAGRDSLHTAFSRCFQALAAERPVVLLIDDLHFAPEDGLSLFASLACAVPEHPILLIGTLRSRPGGSWHEDLDHLDHVETVTLPRLPDYEVARLLEDAVGPATLDGRLAARISEEARGNPFFLFEILGDLKEREILTRRVDGRWISEGRPDDVTVPATVRHIVTARLAELSDEDREFLEVAACLGYEFDPLVISDALGITRIRALRRLTHAQRHHGLVRAVGRRFAFDHHQIREVLYHGITPLLREEYHLLLADTLERSVATPPEEVTGALAADICGHWIEGGRPEGALPFVKAAIEHLKGVYHHERAIGFAESTLRREGVVEGAERVRLLLALSELHEIAGEYERVREVLNEAREGADVAGDDALRARIRVNVGRLAGRLGERDAASAILEKAVQIASGAGDRVVETQALTELGNLAADAGDLDRAAEHYEQAIGFAREAGSEKAEANARGNLGQVAWERGELDAAREMCETSAKVFREIGERRGEASMLGVLGLILDDVGDAEKAAEMHRRHLETCREIGYRRGEGIATLNLGETLVQLGRWEEGRHYMERSRQISVEIGDPAGVAYALSNIGHVLRMLGRAEEARETLERALEIARSVEEKRVRIACLLDLAGLATGDEGRKLADEALNLCQKAEYATMTAEAEMALGRIECCQGRRDEARDRFRRASRIAVEGGLPADRLLATAHLGGLGESPDRAEELLRSGADTLSLPRRAEAWFALWRGTGQPEHLARSVEAFESLEERVSEESRGHLRSGVPLYGEILAAAESADGEERNREG